MQDLLRQVNNQPIPVDLSTCGVGGSYVIERLLGTDLLFACALICEGLNDLNIIYPNEIMLYNLVCYVTLTSSNNSVKKDLIFQRDSKQNYLVNPGNVLLSCVIKEYEIEKLVKWRNAGIVTIKWQFYGSGQVEQDSNIHLVNLTTFYDTNFNFPIINDIQWTEIINQTGLNDNRNYELAR